MTLRLRTTLSDHLVSFMGLAGGIGALTASIGLVRRQILGFELSREGEERGGVGSRVRFKGSKSLPSV